MMLYDQLPTSFSSRKISSQQASAQRPKTLKEKQSAADVSPTKILSIAIGKRRQLMEERCPPLRLELQHKLMIQSLCKQLGDLRAQRKSRKRVHKRKQDDEQQQAKKQRHEPTNDKAEMHALGIEPDDACLQVTSPNFAFFEPDPPAVIQHHNDSGYCNDYDENTHTGYTAFCSDPTCSNTCPQPPTPTSTENVEQVESRELTVLQPVPTIQTKRRTRWDRLPEQHDPDQLQMSRDARLRVEPLRG